MKFDREAAKGRCDAASMEPWGFCGMGELFGFDGDNLLRRSYLDDDPEFVCSADAEFTAHARSDLPAALEEIERLRDWLEQIEEVEFKNVGLCRSWAKEEPGSKFVFV